VKFFLFLALLLGGCFQATHDRCSTCTVVSGSRPSLMRFRPDTRTVYVIVPGILGYGWEWDDAVAALRATPNTDFVVFEWDPWGSFQRAGRELASTIDSVMRDGRKVSRVVVVGHSAGGMVAGFALSRLLVPPDRRVDIVTIGAPFAGMKAMPVTVDDPIRSPGFFAIVGTFTRYPAMPRNVRMVSYVTSWPADPVMNPLFGHLPADPEVAPAGSKRIAVDPKENHNFIVAKIVRKLLTSDGKSPAK